MATNCEFNNLLGRYHDGELNAGQRAQFDQHLATCADCPAELEQMRSISQTLRASARPRASAEFMERLEALSANVEDVSIIRFVRRLTAAAAAILLVATLQWAVHKPVSAPPTVAVSSPSGDERMLVDPATAAKNAMSDNSGNLLLAEAPDPLASEIAGGRP